MSDRKNKLLSEILSLTDDILAPSLANTIMDATESIWEKPKDFLADPRFIKCMDELKENMDSVKDGELRMTAGFPTTELRDLSKLKLLPLPVEVGVRRDVTGTDDELMIFDWFPSDGKEPDDIESLGLVINEFLQTLIKALDEM